MIRKRKIMKPEPSVYQKVEKEKSEKNAIISNNNLFKIHFDQKLNPPSSNNNNVVPISANNFIPNGPYINIPPTNLVIKAPKVMINPNMQPQSNINSNKKIIKLQQPALPSKREILKMPSKEEIRGKSPKPESQAVIKEHNLDNRKRVRKGAPQALSKQAIQAGAQKLVKEVKVEAPVKITRVNLKFNTFYP